MHAETPADRRVLSVVSVATVLPLLVAKYLPFTDLPEHVAVVSALVHWRDASFRVAEHYAFAFPRSQYLLFHLIDAGVAFLVGDAEIATRLLLVAVGVSYPLSLRSLLAAIGGDRRLAVFGALVFWNRALAIGFLPFVTAVPLVVWALARVTRDAAEPTPNARRSALLAALAVGLFYLHVAAFIVFVVAAVATLASWTRPRALARRLLWLVPAAVCVGAWAAFGRLAIGRESFLQGVELSYMSPYRGLLVFPLWIHDVWRSHVDEACAIVWWSSLLALVVASISGPVEPLTGLARRFVPLGAAVLVYFLMPYQAGVGVMLNVRLAPLLAVFAVLPLRPREGRWTEVPLAAVCAATIVMSGSSAWEIATAAHDELGDLDGVLARTKPGARVLALNFDTSSRHAQFAPWLYAVAYHRIRKGGVTSYSFTSLGHWPMRYVASGAPPPKWEPFWATNPCVFRNAVDGPYYDFVLARGAVDPFADEPPGPRFVRVAGTRSFVLYAKTAEPPWLSRGDTPDDGPCVRRLPAAETPKPSPP